MNERSIGLLVKKIIRLVSETGMEYLEAENLALRGCISRPPSSVSLVRLYDEEIARQSEDYADRCRMEEEYPIPGE